MDVTANKLGHISAIGLILAKRPITFNSYGQAEIELKLLLGQKSTLIRNTRKFSNREIIQACACGDIALTIQSDLNVGREIHFDAELITISHILKIIRLKSI